MYKPIPIRRQVSENLRTQFFSGLKVLLLWLKSIPWAGNELRGNDEENCENSQLTLKNLSHLL